MKIYDNKYIIHNGDKYHKIYRILRDSNTGELIFPKIVGLKGLNYMEETRSGYKPDISCRLDNAIYRSHRLKEISAKIVGTFASGKSVLLSQIVMFKMADFFRNGKNYGRYHPFTFVDSFNEVRHIALYGFFHQETNQFIPFKINYIIPHEVELEKSDRLRKLLHRKNVRISKYKNLKEIADMIIKEPYTIHAIYNEPLRTHDQLKMFVLLYEYFRKAEIDREDGNDPILFFHHEISQLFPATLSSENAKLLTFASDRFVEYRKAGVMVCVAMQLQTELYYRFNHKFIIVLNMRQNPSASMHDPQKRSITYKTGDFNVELDGYYMDHSIGTLQELTSVKLRHIGDNYIDIDDYLTDKEIEIIYGKDHIPLKKALRVYRNNIIRSIHLQFPNFTQDIIANILMCSQQLVAKTLKESKNVDENILKFNFKK